ncbi:MAG: hypothetical protein WC959_09195 [Kiritimatiellales bacterium]
MKIIILIALFNITVSALTEEAFHFFIFSGQSDMAGIDPENSFIQAVQNACATNVIIIKDATSEQPV